MTTIKQLKPVTQHRVRVRRSEGIRVSLTPDELKAFTDICWRRNITKSNAIRKYVLNEIQEHQSHANS